MLMISRILCLTLVLSLNSNAEVVVDQFTNAFNTRYVEFGDLRSGEKNWKNLGIAGKYRVVTSLPFAKKEFYSEKCNRRKKLKSLYSLLGFCRSEIVTDPYYFKDFELDEYKRLYSKCHELLEHYDVKDRFSPLYFLRSNITDFSSKSLQKRLFCSVITAVKVPYSDEISILSTISEGKDPVDYSFNLMESLFIMTMNPVGIDSAPESIQELYAKYLAKALTVVLKKYHDLASDYNFGYGGRNGGYTRLSFEASLIDFLGKYFDEIVIKKKDTSYDTDD